jgi:hypothetical protein
MTQLREFIAKNLEQFCSAKIPEFDAEQINAEPHELGDGLYGVHYQDMYLTTYAHSAEGAKAVMYDQLQRFKLLMAQCNHAIVLDLIEAAAKSAHNVNRLYAETLGEDVLEWDALPVEMRRCTVQGVLTLIASPKNTPEMMHISWMHSKQKDGWIYGEKKDMTLKTHPCMVDYAELPEAQRLKDKLFTGAVLPYVEVIHNLIV